MPVWGDAAKSGDETVLLSEDLCSVNSENPFAPTKYSMSSKSEDLVGNRSASVIDQAAQNYFLLASMMRDREN